MNKNMVKDKVLFWLNQGIEKEVVSLKAFLENNSEPQVEEICTTISVLAALKNQAEEMIDKL